MSRSKNVASYPPEMLEILRNLTDDNLPFRVRFPNQREAKDWRLSWYGFRKAVEEEAEAWGTSTDIHRDLRRTAAYAVRVRKDPFETGVWLIFEMRISPEVSTSFQEALAGLRRSDSPPTPSPGSSSVGEAPAAASAHSDVLRNLGFTATQPIIPGTEPEGGNSA